MTRGSKWLILIVSLGAVFTAVPLPAAAEISTSQAIEAIQRYVCFSDYWEYQDGPALGSMLSMSIRKDGDRAFAWVEDFVRSPYGQHTASFLEVFTFGGRTTIAWNQRYPIGIAPGDDELFNRSRVFRNGVEVVPLMVSSDCTPHFDSDTPLKERMLLSIQAVIAQSLSDFNRSGVSNYSRRLTIVLANFNVDYPTVFVLLRETREIFGVHFGSYFPQPDEISVYPIVRTYQIEALRPKIEMYGIPMEIELGG